MAIAFLGAGRVCRDSTVSVEGSLYEIDGALLSGQLVTAARCLADLAELPWGEYRRETGRLAAPLLAEVKQELRTLAEL